MRDEPQDAPYHPDPQINAIADWIGDGVDPADFPKTILRFRNMRWDKSVGLGQMADADWLRHFGRFEALSDNLPRPLALRYHGHQFRVYNPEIGDGRGFLFAQMRDAQGRLLDCGTKGSGTTPYSRSGDGRLTLKGAVREILATEMLEAQGVNTSKTFAVIETGEQLTRGDEPSPTRSAVMTRLSHSHIRIGTFQRLAAFEEVGHLGELVDYCLAHYPGPMPPDDAPGRDEPAVILMHQAVERLADLAASYMVAGFVHGVLNTDNMNITGESFDYGPWRWLPRWAPEFTAAYFDREGLYAFGRQPEALRWNLGQLAIALRRLTESEPLIAALDRYGELYQANMIRRFCWRLGVESKGMERDGQLIDAAEKTMRSGEIGPDIFFHVHRFGGHASGVLAAALDGYEAAGEPHDYWHRPAPESMLIEEVEAIWDAIDQRDDWFPLEEKVAALRLMGDALGEPPAPAGQA